MVGCYGDRFYVTVHDFFCKRSGFSEKLKCKFHLPDISKFCSASSSTRKARLEDRFGLNGENFGLNVFWLDGFERIPRRRKRERERESKPYHERQTKNYPPFARPSVKSRHAMLAS